MESTGTIVTSYTLSILQELDNLDRGTKSHQLIQLARQHAKKKLSPGQWMNILDALVHRGFLAIDHSRIELVLTDRGKQFVASPAELLVDIDQPAPILPPEILPQFDETLYHRLRWKRRKVAEMATYRPESLDELRALHGVGKHLSTKYGPVFLSAIQNYLRSVA